MAFAKRTAVASRAFFTSHATVTRSTAALPNTPCYVSCPVCDEQCKRLRGLLCGHTMCATCYRDNSRNGRIKCLVCGKLTSMARSVPNSSKNRRPTASQNVRQQSSAVSVTGSHSQLSTSSQKSHLSNNSHRSQITTDSRRSQISSNNRRSQTSNPSQKSQPSNTTRRSTTTDRSTKDAKKAESTHHVKAAVPSPVLSSPLKRPRSAMLQAQNVPSTIDIMVKLTEDMGYRSLRHARLKLRYDRVLGFQLKKLMCVGQSHVIGLTNDAVVCGDLPPTELHGTMIDHDTGTVDLTVTQLDDIIICSVRSVRQFRLLTGPKPTVFQVDILDSRNPAEKLPILNPADDPQVDKEFLAVCSQAGKVFVLIRIVSSIFIDTYRVRCSRYQIQSSVLTAVTDQSSRMSMQLIGSNYFICSYSNNVLYKVSSEGIVVSKYGCFGYKEAGELNGPIICGKDRFSLLIADCDNNRLQLLETNTGSWSVLRMDMDLNLQHPETAAVDALSRQVYVSQKRPFKLVFCEVSSAPRPETAPTVEPVTKRLTAKKNIMHNALNSGSRHNALEKNRSTSSANNPKRNRSGHLLHNAPESNNRSQKLDSNKRNGFLHLRKTPLRTVRETPLNKPVIKMLTIGERLWLLSTDEVNSFRITEADVRPSSSFTLENVTYDSKPLKRSMRRPVSASFSLSLSSLTGSMHGSRTMLATARQACRAMKLLDTSEEFVDMCLTSSEDFLLATNRKVFQLNHRQQYSSNTNSWNIHLFNSILPESLEQGLDEIVALASMGDRLTLLLRDISTSSLQLVFYRKTSVHFLHLCTVETGVQDDSYQLSLALINSTCYVSSAGRHCIYELDLAGSLLVTHGRFGFVQPGELNCPKIVETNRGSLLVVDQGNHRLQVFDTQERNFVVLRQERRGEKDRGGEGIDEGKVGHAMCWPEAAAIDEVRDELFVSTRKPTKLLHLAS